MLKVIVCGYKCVNTLDRCLKSIKTQSYKDYNLIVSVVEDSDRMYLLENTVKSIARCSPKPDDIIVLIDADDFLTDEDAFKIISEVYKNNPEVLLTYGSYVNLSSSKTGKFCFEYEEHEDVRTSPWKGSHLKTFKYKLFQKIPDSELRDDDGEYYKCCADRALMIPMMEIAGYDRVRYIPMILYCYNDTNPISVWKTMRSESKRIRELLTNKNKLGSIQF